MIYMKSLKYIAIVINEVAGIYEVIDINEVIDIC